MQLRINHTTRRIQAVLFDMDGVLVDSVSLHIESWNKILLGKGFPPFGNELYFSVLGHTNMEMLIAFNDHNHITMSPNQIKEILICKEVAFRENILHHAKVTPGVIEWLTFFNRNHILCSVASSGTMANITLILHTLKIADYFASVISGMFFPASKPDPQIFLSAAASLGVPAEDCLVIEDAPFGIQASKSAKMTCCAIATSYPKNLLAGADLVLESLAEISPEKLFVNA